MHDHNSPHISGDSTPRNIEDENIKAIFKEGLSSYEGADINAAIGFFSRV
jgi:hypothetical protein